MPHKMMKKTLLLALTLLTFSCSTTVKIEKTNVKNILKTSYKRTEGIILEKDYYNENNTFIFTPSSEEILKAESILKLRIKETNTLMLNQGENCPIIHKNLMNYFRQYIGRINQQGERIIMINMLWNKHSLWKRTIDDRIEYRKGYYYVLDGCSYYWCVSVNLTTEKLENFSVNGNA